MQCSGWQRKSALGGSGQKLQPAGFGGLQTLPGLHPKVRSELGSKGSELPVGAAGQRVTSKAGVTVTDAVTVTGGGVTVLVMESVV